MPKVRYDGKDGPHKGVPVKRTMRIGSRKSGKSGMQMTTEALTTVANGKGKNAVKARKILALRNTFRNS